jgi:hypothetical protein
MISVVVLDKLGGASEHDAKCVVLRAPILVFVNFSANITLAAENAWRAGIGSIA